MLSLAIKNTRKYKKWCPIVGKLVISTTGLIFLLSFIFVSKNGYMEICSNNSVLCVCIFPSHGEGVGNEGVAVDLRNLLKSPTQGLLSGSCCGMYLKYYST